MRNACEYKKIGDICDIKTGKLDANAASENGIYPFFTCSKETLAIDSYSYDCECVLIAGNGDLNVKYYKGKFDAYQRTYIITIKPQYKYISTQYLYQFFCKYVEKLRQLSIGGVIKYIKLGNLTDAQIKVPPIEEQEAICSLLDNLNLVIEKKKQQIEELDKLVQSLFYDMFGDPFTNEKGWDVKTIKDSCKRLYAGGDVPKDRFCKEKNTDYTIPIFSNGTENNGLYGYTDEPRETENCITIAGRGTIGYCVIRREPFFPIIRLIVAVPKDEINVVYLKGVIDCLKLKGQGVAIPQLTIPMIKDNIIPVPPLPLQQAFAEKVKAIEQQKELINQSIKDVQTLFDAEMDYYFGD